MIYNSATLKKSNLPQTQRQTSEYLWCELCHEELQCWHVSAPLTKRLKRVDTVKL